MCPTKVTSNDQLLAEVAEQVDEALMAEVRRHGHSNFDRSRSQETEHDGANHLPTVVDLVPKTRYFLLAIRFPKIGHS